MPRGFIPHPLPPLRCLDMGRRLLTLAAAVALGKALTCLPKFLDLDFLEVGAGTTGIEGNNDNDDNNTNAMTSTFPSSDTIFSRRPPPRHCPRHACYPCLTSWSWLPHQHCLAIQAVNLPHVLHHRLISLDPPLVEALKVPHNLHPTMHGPPPQHNTVILLPIDDGLRLPCRESFIV